MNKSFYSSARRLIHGLALTLSLLLPASFALAQPALPKNVQITGKPSMASLLIWPSKRARWCS
ncbi:MAG: hypothetical protein HC858_04975 [Brachymonas sp.]|nr:hypothetical protein [Brachymonas sp.]